MSMDSAETVPAITKLFLWFRRNSHWLGAVPGAPRAPLQRGSVEPERARRALGPVVWEHCSLSLARAKSSGYEG